MSGLPPGYREAILLHDERADEERRRLEGIAKWLEDLRDTLRGSAIGAEEALEQTITKYKGNYILAVEGNPPLADDGIYCIPGGKPFVDKLRRVAKDAKAIVSWGSCASWGCVQAAKPNPTRATPVHKVITDKPIIKVPGCPPIAEVMTAVVTYVATFGKIPELDRQGRPKMFYSQRIHDKCYRRPHFDAGQFVEHFDDAGARMGYCLYKVGCKGPVTYNACSATRWNEGLSFPIQSGHGCLGCSEAGFWDVGPFYKPLSMPGQKLWNLRPGAPEGSAPGDGPLARWAVLSARRQMRGAGGRKLAQPAIDAVPFSPVAVPLVASVGVVREAVGDHGGNIARRDGAWLLVVCGLLDIGAAAFDILQATGRRVRSPPAPSRGRMRASRSGRPA